MKCSVDPLSLSLSLSFLCPTHRVDHRLLFCLFIFFFDTTQSTPRLCNRRAHRGAYGGEHESESEAEAPAQAEDGAGPARGGGRFDDARNARQAERHRTLAL